jgi:hypothetical protein
MTRALTIILILALAVAALADAVNLELADAVKSRVSQMRLKPEEAQALAGRKPVAIGMATKASEEIAGTGAVLTEGDADALADSYRSLAFLRQNVNVAVAGKFGATPALADLSKLTVDQSDLSALLKCRPGSCDVKLSAAEIARVQSVVGQARALSAALKAKLTAEYKQILLDRVKAYLANGDAALGSYADQSAPVDAAEAFAALARAQSGASSHCQYLSSFMENCVSGKKPAAESFVYWAKQRFGDSKPVISLVHVMIEQDGDRTFVASKQLYASHYTEAGLLVAELIPFADAGGHPRTLVVNTVRLRLDVLGGAFGFVKKRAAQPRLLDALRESLDWLRVNCVEAGVGSGE